MLFSWQNAKRYYVFRSILCIDAELETSEDFLQIQFWMCRRIYLNVFWVPKSQFSLSFPCRVRKCPMFLVEFCASSKGTGKSSTHPPFWTQFA